GPDRPAGQGVGDRQDARAVLVVEEGEVGDAAPFEQLAGPRLQIVHGGQGWGCTRNQLRRQLVEIGIGLPSTIPGVTREPARVGPAKRYGGLLVARDHRSARTTRTRSTCSRS